MTNDTHSDRNEAVMGRMALERDTVGLHSTGDSF